jgi:DNA repair exonuclease SbcCD nuclease subunit
MIADFESRGIDTIVFTGDIFDNRRFIATDVLDKAYRLFKERLAKFTCYVIAGNHDMLYDNSSDVCQIRFLENLPNVNVYIDKVGFATIGHNKWYFVPWIQEDKIDGVNKWLVKMSRGNIDDNIIVGHFDMIGAQMEAKTVSTAGFDPKRFLNAAKLTISGHYHCRSYNKGKDPDSSILYLGTPYHLSFAHVGTDCGYYIVDEDMKFEFVENTLSPRFVDVDDEHLEGLGDLTNCFVRYYYKNDRPYDDASARKKVLMEAKPLYVKNVPYGGDVGTVEDAKRLDDEEARKILGADSLTMAEMYMDKYPEQLPVFWSGEDPKQKILGILSTYGQKQ